MTYVKIQDGEVIFPYTINQFWKAHPDRSLSELTGDSTLSEYGVYPVTILDAPIYDKYTQWVCYDSKPTENNGQWELRWSLQSYTEKQAAAYKVSVEALKNKTNVT
jgi:hypothetical protein